jgi:putative Ig domain-containing protein
MGHGIAMARGMRAGLALLLLLSAAEAFGFPVTWTFSGATFTDGGTASGFFVYDADAQLVSDWSIDVAGGDTGTFPPLTYTPANSSAGFSSVIGIQFDVNASFRQLRVPAAPQYSDAGGTVNIDVNNTYQGECFNCSPFRPFNAGTMTGYAAPVFTSAAATTFVAGSAGSFAVSVTGTPTLALSESGTLPAGVTFVDNGNGSATLAGTATVAGSYPIVLTATNGGQAPTTQNFTLTIAAPFVPPTQAPALDFFGQAALALALLLLGLAARTRSGRRLG